MMAKTFKALSALLSYPSRDLQDAAAEIGKVVHSEGIVGGPAVTAVMRFANELAAADLFELQERYVDLFDKSRRRSLHMIQHVHGESRDRGQAMVDLASLYEQGGLALTANELPDYLPLFLEYLSTRPLDEARSVLADALHIIVALEERLAERHAGYAAIFAAVRDAAGDRTLTAGPADIVFAEDAEGDLAALDAAWEETAVTFGPGESLDGCSVDRLKIQVRAGRRDARRMQA
jgi:nitrate reductase delta subunit